MKFPSIIGEKCTRAPYNLKFWDPPASTAPLRKIAHKNFGLVLSSIFARIALSKGLTPTLNFLWVAGGCTFGCDLLFELRSFVFFFFCSLAGCFYFIHLN